MGVWVAESGVQRGGPGCSCKSQGSSGGEWGLGPGQGEITKSEARRSTRFSYSLSRGPCKRVRVSVALYPAETKQAPSPGSRGK